MKGLEKDLNLSLDCQYHVNNIPEHKLNNHIIYPLKILIIEDNRDFTDLLISMLMTMGHQVIAAYDGINGFEHAKIFKPDAILCDIGLPGMNGFEVARNIKADNLLKDVYLIALSGYATESDIKSSIEAGFNQHLAKPVQLRKIQEIFNNFVSPEYRSPAARVGILLD